MIHRKYINKYVSHCNSIHFVWTYFFQSSGVPLRSFESQPQDGTYWTRSVLTRPLQELVPPAHSVFFSVSTKYWKYLQYFGPEAVVLTTQQNIVVLFFLIQMFYFDRLHVKSRARPIYTFTYQPIQMFLINMAAMKSPAIQTELSQAFGKLQ